MRLGRQARDGDRFTLMVRSPSQYDGATIEGHVTQVNRSLRPEERVRRHVVLQDRWRPDSDELTPTDKLADGIRRFHIDASKLEEFVLALVEKSAAA